MSILISSNIPFNMLLAMIASGLAKLFSSLPLSASE
jgi:hypothetical protein